MMLYALIRTLSDSSACGSLDADITSVVSNSRRADAGSLFVAIRGERADGHRFLDDAYSRGARAFVTEDACNKPGATCITVPDTRAALGQLAAAFYGDPTRFIKLIGITGTNGKTTTAHLIEAVLHAAGEQAGLLGTISYRYSGHEVQAGRTTPDALELQELFSRMQQSGTQWAVMEVSSHGCAQHRIDGCHFDAAVFTNLTPEHLDYHKNMEDYFSAKQRLFNDILPKSDKAPVAVINIDDPAGARLARACPCPVVTYGMHSGDVQARDITFSLAGTAATITTPRDTLDVKAGLVGAFNLYNILAATAACSALGIPGETISRGISRAAGVPGRMERIDNTRGIMVFVDYAHTADALEQVLGTLKAAGAETIITVFGCGGDRDRTKRPVMGRVAAQLSTVVVLTSDNPRSEPPETILDEIEPGVQGEGFVRADCGDSPCLQSRAYFVVSDRRAAIRQAIGMARAGDVVLIAGKGHETTQQTGDEKQHFDDREEARHALQMCA